MKRINSPRSLKSRSIEFGARRRESQAALITRNNPPRAGPLRAGYPEKKKGKS